MQAQRLAVQKIGQAFLAAGQLGGIGLVVIALAFTAPWRLPVAPAFVAPVGAAVGVAFPVAGLGQGGFAAARAAIAPVSAVRAFGRYRCRSCLNLILAVFSTEIIII